MVRHKVINAKVGGKILFTYWLFNLFLKWDFFKFLIHGHLTRKPYHHDLPFRINIIRRMRNKIISLFTYILSSATKRIFSQNFCKW